MRWVSTTVLGSNPRWQAACLLIRGPLTPRPRGDWLAEQRIIFSVLTVAAHDVIPVGTKRQDPERAEDNHLAD